MRRSSSQRAARSRSFGSRACALSQSSACLLVPVKDLLSGPQAHARPLAYVLVQPLEIGDAMRHASDVGMHADRHHARGLLALEIEAIEMVDAAAQPFLRRMVLQNHHGDV